MISGEGIKERVGGSYPALIEAMAYGNCVIANKVSEVIDYLIKIYLF